MPKPKSKPAKSEEKYKLTLSVSRDLARRFATFCAHHERDQSDVAAELMTRAMAGFVVSFRGGKADPGQVGEGDPSDGGDGPTVRLAG